MKNWLSSLYICFATLTSIPLPFGKKVIYSGENRSRSTAFFPLAGLFYGLFSGAVYFFLFPAIKDPGLTAFVLLSIPYLVSKFFHLDGLSDTLDGLLADRTPKERLAIMKDSRTGSFALGGTVLFLILKFLLLKKMLSLNDPLPLFIYIPVLSRFGIVFLSFISKHPQKDSTAFRIIGYVKPAWMIFASLLSLLIALALVLTWGAGLVFPLASGLIVTAAAASLIRFYSFSRIGGVTGDVLGACLEISEAAAIVLFLVIC